MSAPDGHSVANNSSVRPRAVRRPDCIVLEASDGRDYRVALARLRSYRDVLWAARYLASQPHVGGREIAGFITVACNAVGLELPDR